MERNEDKIKKKIQMKEEKAIEEFDTKKTVLRSSFNENINKMIQNIERQRDTIS